VVRHKNTFQALKIKYDSQMFVFGVCVCFSKGVLHNGLEN